MDIDKPKHYDSWVEFLVYADYFRLNNGEGELSSNCMPSDWSGAIGELTEAKAVAEENGLDFNRDYNRL